MGADRIDNDGISARIIEQLVFKDETARVGELSDWTSAEKSKVSTRVHEVLEPKGLIEKAGTEELADPLNDANLWRLTEDGAEWALRNLDDVYEEIFDEKPGAIIVKLLHRTESVEHHMESVRGEFETVKDEIEELQEHDQQQKQEQQVPDQYRSQTSKLHESVQEQSDRLDTIRGHFQSLADDVAELREQTPSGAARRIESLEQRLDTLEQQTDAMESHLDDIDGANRKLADEVEAVQERVDRLIAER